MIQVCGGNRGFPSDTRGQSGMAELNVAVNHGGAGIPNHSRRGWGLRMRLNRRGRGLSWCWGAKSPKTGIARWNVGNLRVGVLLGAMFSGRAVMGGC